mgnify:CR=1 FL=1
MKVKTAITAAAIFGSAYCFYEHAFPKRTEYTVNTPEDIAGMRILMLSDLHCNPFICNNERFLQRLKKEAPDVILLPGDMFSKHAKTQNERVPFFLQRLSAIAPVIMSVGNHEEELKHTDSERFALYKQMLTEFGICVLDNEAVTMRFRNRDINFIGLSLPLSVYKKKGSKETKPLNLDYSDAAFRNQTIMLAHHPDYFKEYQEYASLIVSGHNHGGLVRLPVFGGMISPQMYHTKYMHGAFTENDTTMVVSAGIGSHTLPARLFNRIEYCVITTVCGEEV